VATLENRILVGRSVGGIQEIVINRNLGEFFFPLFPARSLIGKMGEY
jgi:hypothetical protein